MNLLATIVIADVIGGLVLHKLLKRKPKQTQEKEIKEIETSATVLEKPH